MKLEECRTISDIFELVKSLVWKSLRKEQAGLMVGIADLGTHPEGFIGAYYSLNANSIVINKKPLAKIEDDYYKPYLFHLILHEYIHSLGFFDEEQARRLTYKVSKNYFGRSHIVTQFAVNMNKFFPILHNSPIEDPNIDFLPNIDRRNTGYIA